MAKSNAERMRRREIFDLQNMLYIVSRHKKGTADILPDGVMGDETTKAIIAFQTENGLEATGVANFETRELLRDLFDEAMLEKSRAQYVHFFDIGVAPIIKRGDNSDSVYMIQMIFRTLSNKFRSFTKSEINGLFDEITEDNVKEFQRINSFEELGIVDRKTWDRLAMYYNFYA